MFDCQSREMGIGDQLGTSSEIAKQAGENGPVRGARNRYPDAFAVKPLFHMTPCRRDRLRAFENPGIRHEPHKCEQTLPCQAYASITAQLIIEPAACLLVAFGARIGGVDQDVCIDEDHPRVFPALSTSSNTSQMLSRFANRQDPISIGLVRNGLRVFGRLSSFKPRRSAELTASLNVSFCLARQASSWAATSSSRLSVVLIHHSIAELMS